TFPLLAAACCALACTQFKSGSDIGIDSGSFSSSPESPAQSSEWSCLATPRSTAAPLVLGNTNVTYTMFIADTVSRKPPPGLVVSACSPLDIDCMNPVADSVPPGADGFVRLSVPQNFSGFFIVKSSETVNSVLFIDGPITADMTAPPMLVIGEAALQTLTQTQNVNIQMGTGNLLLRAWDCDQMPASGVQFSSDHGGVPFSFVNTLPVVGQTVTDDDGAGGFLNVSPGLAIVKATLADGTVTRTSTGRVSANWFTYVDLNAKAPSP
ncbi:MAG TPA: hypothetical protein VG963_12505, partial [Polyangiaceae bacterium]|nr:hypothetical protein [Polyangiaceae bacterium]